MPHADATKPTAWPEDPALWSAARYARQLFRAQGRGSASARGEALDLMTDILAQACLHYKTGRMTNRQLLSLVAEKNAMLHAVWGEAGVDAERARVGLDPILSAAHYTLARRAPESCTAQDAMA